MQKTEFIGVIGTVQSYLKKWGKRLNFGNNVAKIARKVECVMGERKLNFGNEITEILVLPMDCQACLWSAQNACEGSKWKPIVAMALLKMGGKKK